MTLDTSLPPSMFDLDDTAASATRAETSDRVPAIEGQQLAPHHVLIDVVRHPVSANAPAGHWSWICQEHGVGTVGVSFAAIAEKLAHHMHVEAPDLKDTLW